MFLILRKISLFISLIIPSVVCAQFTTIESYGSKSNSLANVTTTFKDINACYTNQAGLAFLQGTEMNLSYENRFLVPNLSAMNFAIAKNFKNIGSFGINIKKFGISEYSELLLGISYARKLSQKTGLGLQINAYNLNIKNYGNKNAISFEIGIIHDLNSSLTLGFHVSNPFPIKYNESTNIPTIIALGVKYKISNSTSLFTEVEKQLGYDFFIKMAIEYSPFINFSFYLGSKNNLNDFADYSMGFKYNPYSKFSIIVATNYNLTLGLSPSIGITYSLYNKLKS